MMILGFVCVAIVHILSRVSIAQLCTQIIMSVLEASMSNAIIDVVKYTYIFVPVYKIQSRIASVNVNL